MGNSNNGNNMNYNFNQNFPPAKNIKPKSRVKDIVGIIFLVFMFIVLPLYWLVSGIITVVGLQNGVALNELNRDSKYVDTIVNYSSKEYKTVTNAVNLIPIGKDHYFMVYDKEKDNSISIRANKNFAKQFDSTGYSKKGIRVKGKIRSFKNKYSGSISLTGYSDSESGYFVDTQAGKFAIFKIVEGFLSIAIAISIFILKKKAFVQLEPGVKVVDSANYAKYKTLAKIILFALIAWGLLLLYILLYQ